MGHLISVGGVRGGRGGALSRGLGPRWKSRTDQASIG
jgi:hypothetical protein